MRPRPQACPAALSFMASGQFDVRPHLVALYYGDIQTGLPAILGYGHAYMVAWCARRQLMPSEDLLRCAVTHGLLRLCEPRRAGSVETRAKQCRIRAGTFRLLSDAARETFRRRLTEGAARFVEVAAHSDDPLPSSTVMSPGPESTWWSRVEAGRRNSIKLIELEVGNRYRPPALDPRAPSRDNGWLPSFGWAA